MALLHEGHPGTSRMKKLAQSFVWWPGMDRDIEEVVKKCKTCQENQTMPKHVAIYPWEWPNRPWSRIHIDFAGPFQGKVFLIVVDVYSKWMEVEIVPSTSSCHAIEKLWKMFATHGVPETLVSDNGTAFTSAEFQEFMCKSKIQHIKTAPYHPSLNGLAERAVQTFKRAIQKSLPTVDIQTAISRFLFHYRSTPHSTTMISPAELLMNRRIRTHLEMIKPDMNTSMKRKQLSETERMHLKGSFRNPTFKVGDTVFAKKFGIQKPKWLPGTIVEIHGATMAEIKLEDQRTIRRHFDQIRSRAAESTNTSDWEFPSVTIPSSLPRRSTRETKPPERFEAGRS